MNLLQWGEGGHVVVELNNCIGNIRVNIYMERQEELLHVEQLRKE